MYKFSVSKELFEDILLKKTNILKKENSKYWKKELINVEIKENKISYSIKQVDKIFISNGLGDDKPQLIINCNKIDYLSQEDSFVFYLGSITEQKNTSLSKDYKDLLIEQLLKEKQQLEDSLNKDHLTTVYNRRKMQDDLQKFIKQNNSFLLTAIFIDVDRFKGINDNFGHVFGDKVLIFLGEKLIEYSKKLNGFAYRYGGEEFVILCFVTKDRLIATLNSLKEDIKSQKINHPKRDISVTISMGISFFDDFKNQDVFLKKADEALYKAKQNGRDRIEFSYLNS